MYEQLKKSGRPKCLKKMTTVVEFFNQNYDTNHPLIIKHLNDYIHSAHRTTSLKMDGYNQSYQPSWPERTVESYRVYYDNDSLMQYNHKSGRIVLIFTDNCEVEIGLFVFKKYLRRVYKYRTFNEK